MTRRTATDDGVSVVELLVTMSLMLVLAGVGITAFQHYAYVQDHRGTAEDIVSTLRTVAQRSLSEGRTYCVSFDTTADRWTVYRRECSAAGTVVDGGAAARGTVALDSPSFAAPVTPAPCPQTNACAYFYPRGTGSPGTVRVQRAGMTDLTVSVEGLTGRVSLS